MRRWCFAVGLCVWFLPGLAAGAPIADEDCRACHAGASRPDGAADLSAYYSGARAHHPVGVHYPTDPRAWSYAQPTANQAGGAFFDADADGVADEDEVRLYGPPPHTVECASCHRAHGIPGLPAQEHPAWLRMANEESRLCMVCHRQ